MAEQKGSSPQPPAFRQTVSRLGGLGGTTTEIRSGGPLTSFAAHRAHVESLIHAARTNPQPAAPKASIYANDRDAFRRGNEQERMRSHDMGGRLGR
jgi:uridine phosphorylase